MTEWKPIYTTAELAKLFGVSSRAIRAMAVRHNIGIALTSRLRIYTAADIERLTERITPPKPPA